MQFGLKQAGEEGGDCEDGQAPARRRRRGKAKAKAEPKAKPKASGKAKAKAKGSKSPAAAVDPESAPNPAGESMPSPEPKAKAKAKARGKAAARKRPAAHVETEKFQKKGPFEKEELVMKDDVNRMDTKCFAKRKRPNGYFAGLKWDALRDAFVQKIRPHLSTYSAHEDWFVQGCSFPDWDRSRSQLHDHSFYFS